MLRSIFLFLMFFIFSCSSPEKEIDSAESLNTVEHKEILAFNKEKFSLSDPEFKHLNLLINNEQIN